ncbi:MAG: TolC family protein, partial [Flavisolibacter sp.]|nr:TolC family protein [Flavisolibacter sp.]
MKKALLIQVGLLLLAGLAQAQQQHELTVKEAVELAYKNVVELKNVQLDYKIQEAQNKEIIGRALPQVSSNASANYYLSLPKFLFPNAQEAGIYSVLLKEGLLPQGTRIPPVTFQQVSFQLPWNLSVGATVQQLLFQPDVFVGLQARQAALDYATANIEQTKEKIKDSAYRRYYAILIAEKQLHFIDESIIRLEKLYRDDSIMYKNGFAERLDVDRVLVQLNNLRSTRSIVENSVQLSYAAMKFALGLPQQDVVVLKENLTTEKIKEGILEPGFKYEDRAVIRTLSQTQRLQELDVRRNRLSNLPTVALSGNYSINAMGQKFFTNPSTIWLNSSFIGLNVALPIFDGMQRKYRIQQAQLKVQKVENTIMNVKQAIDFEQVVTWESLKNALLNLDAQERNLQLAEKVYNTTKLKFEQGLGSSFEVLQSDADYQTAQANYFNALYNATVARVGYLSALGRL